MADRRESDARDLAPTAVARIAEAFELTPEDVRQDGAAVAGWLGGEAGLLAALTARHGWDASVAPYYVYWLRGRRGEPPA